MPFEESVGALAELREEGRSGASALHVSAEQLEEAREILPIAPVQNRYNPTDRSSESVLEACERAGKAFMPRFPWRPGASRPRRAARRDPRPP